jgi:hypothetical protein
MSTPPEGAGFLVGQPVCAWAPSVRKAPRAGIALTESDVWCIVGDRHLLPEGGRAHGFVGEPARTSCCRAAPAPPADAHGGNGRS